MNDKSIPAAFSRFNLPDNYNPENDLYIFSSLSGYFNFEFEIPLASHCNLNCQMCTVFSPLAEKSFTDPASIERDLARMRDLFGDEKIWLRFVGGEPTLHPQLIDIIGLSRKIHKKALISLTSNGLNTFNLGQEFLDACKSNDIVVLISPYPPVQIDKVLNFYKNNDILAFRTVKSFTTRQFLLDIHGRQDKNDAFNNCRYHCNFLLGGSISRCFYPATVRHLNKYYNMHFNVSDNDLLNIHNHDSSEIIEFLNAPMDFCKYCMNKKAKYFQWEKSRKMSYEWVSI